MLLTQSLKAVNFVAGLELLVVSFVIYLLGVAVYHRYFHNYKDIPGPFWASITSLWYFRAVRYGRNQDYQLPIHKIYGSMVRLAPNMVQISDPLAIETIYGPKNSFIKGEFYDSFNSKIGPRRGLFEERDEKIHAIRRRVVAPLYTQAAVLEYEPCVDRCIALFYEKMDKFVKSGESFDMSLWIRKYTFDVIGEIFYGREGGFGFVRDNIDYNNWCKLMDTMPKPASSMAYMPYGLRTLYFMSQLLSKETRIGAKGFFDVIDQSHAAVKQRIDDIAANKPVNKNDVLSKLLDLVNNEKGDKNEFTILDVTVEIWTTIWAGSDNTAIALTSIFYHLHKHPRTLKKLRDEIEESFENGTLKYPLRYNDCIKLPYLHAVVREAMRIYPSLGTGLPRIVPRGGVEICGRFFPEGHEVLMNPSAINFDEEIYGEDAQDFVPERWLRGGERGAANMERNMLNFGYGPRICIGKYITTTEMYKLLPTILRDFEFELLNDEWTCFRGWFSQQKDVMVRATRRRERDPAIGF